MDRRELIKRGLRGLALGGLIALGVTLGKSRPKKDSAPACRIDLPCQQCRKRNTCTDIKNKTEGKNE